MPSTPIKDNKTTKVIIKIKRLAQKNLRQIKKKKRRHKLNTNKRKKLLLLNKIAKK
jgi:RIO-like serine/threonine protein kinase